MLHTSGECKYMAQLDMVLGGLKYDCAHQVPYGKEIFTGSTPRSEPWGWLMGGMVCGLPASKTPSKTNIYATHQLGPVSKTMSKTLIPLLPQVILPT
jgi:hypothetical protein